MDAALFERLQAERDQLFRTADDLHTEWDVACHERVNTMLLAEEKIEEARFAQGILVDAQQQVASLQQELTTEVGLEVNAKVVVANLTMDVV